MGIGISGYWYWWILVLVLGIPIPNLIRINIGYSGFSHEETAFGLKY